MYIGIIYPALNRLKVAARRTIEHYKIRKYKFSVLLDVDEELRDEISQQLQLLGSQVQELDSNDKKQKWTDQDIEYLMDFFQKNKPNLKLEDEDETFFENLIKRYKNE